MAEEQERVIFGAEFNSTNLVSGVEEAVAAFETLNVGRAKLEKGVIALNSVLTLNNKEIKAVEKELKSLDKTSVTYAKDVEALNEQLRTMRGENAIVSKDLLQAKKNLEAIVITTKEYNKGIAEQKEKMGDIHKQWEKLTNIQGYAGEVIKKVKNHVGELVVGLVTGFAGGIAATVIPSIVSWISKMVEASGGLETLKKKREALDEVTEKAAQNVGKDVAQLEIFKKKLNDLSLSETDRVKIAKEYNKVAEEQNKIDTTQINNLTEINEKIEQQNKLILQRAVALAATAKLGDLATKFVDEQLKVATRLKEMGLTEQQFMDKSGGLTEFEGMLRRRDALVRTAEATGIGSAERGRRRALADQADEEIKKKFGSDVLKKGGILDLIEERDKARGELEEMNNLLSPLITPEGLTTGGKTGKTDKIENVFRQKLLELRARLAGVLSTEFQSEGIIRNKLAAQLEKEFFEIGKLLKEKKLTGAQADILKGLLSEINQVELSKSLEEFRQKQKDAIQKIDDQITAANSELANRRIANIRDEFTREREAIDQNFTITQQALDKKLKDLLEAIDKDVKKGLLTTEQGEAKGAILKSIFGDLLDQAGRDRTNRQLALSFRSFQNTIQGFKLSLDEELTDLSEGSTSVIQLETDRFLKGQISYAEYQKRLTKILKDEIKERRRLQLEELDKELKAINDRLANTTDEAQRKQLEAQQRAVRGQISGVSRDIAQGDAQQQEETNKKRIDSVLQYATAVQNLLTNIASFWNSVNEVERASLERSIALQETRVERAKEIAEKGNAEYLEQEEKRMDELERKREENARRQMAINQALTLSQAIVATVSAIAQAVQTGSPFAAIAAVGAVIAAIGAGYAFVNSLQQPVASFYQGEEYIDDPNRPRGKDTIPARLHIGERVVTSDKNEAYWDTLTAIHNGLIPAEVLNGFVKHYPNIPVVDYGRISEATNGKINSDSYEVAKKLDKLNETMQGVQEAVGSIALNVNMDENGLGVTLSSFIKSQILRSKA